MDDEIVLHSEYGWAETSDLEEPLIMDDYVGWMEFNVYQPWRSRLLDWWYDHRPHFHFRPCKSIRDNWYKE